MLEEAGTYPDRKLAYGVNPESGETRTIEADYRYDLSDVPQTLLDTFRECGVCLADLDDKLKEEKVVYGVDIAETA